PFISGDPLPLTDSTLSLHDALPIFEPGRIDEHPIRTVDPLAPVDHRLVLAAITARVEVAVRAHDRRRDARRLHEGTQSLLELATDRKSTRLNSSHVKISYAVFCLKK